MERYFWAKTTPDGRPGISVLGHMLNVGNVAQCMANLSVNLLGKFNLRSAEIAALAALHDIGKISPGFQRKCEIWLEENGLTTISRNGVWDTRMESDHGKISHSVIQALLLEFEVDHKVAKFVSAVIGGHHGRLNLPSDRGYVPPNGISEAKSGINWGEERRAVANDIVRYFNIGQFTLDLNDATPGLWWLAGLTSVVDWIGSDERFFPIDKSENPINSSEIATQALDTIGFRSVEIVRGLTFHDLFHEKDKPEVLWTPNEMQEKTIAAITGPGVYIVEAPMGMGKTEAALWASYQLLCEKKATGIYFALPTQATSNRIHIRMNEFVIRIAPEAMKSRLIHSNSWLMDQKSCILPAKTGTATSQDDARTGRDWFSSAKRALLAPFGVGTVDQALLGVVAAKHFFVRHFALAGKVVILDEVHSYDLYTGTLIDKLITTLEGLGCTVIILSATLTDKRRTQTIPITSESVQENGLSPYPLISGRKEGTVINPIAATPPPSRDVHVNFEDTHKAAQEAIEVAKGGGCVLWICNTVDNAQKQFRQFKEYEIKSGIRITLGLLHSRYPFWRREELENEWMERLGKGGNQRCGSILVSTQVVEQSVDLDADLMISELAPTDMLLQRLGRLWRHERKRPEGLHPRLIILSEEKSIEDYRHMVPKDIKKSLGSKASVYDAFVLLRSLEVWGQKSNITIPSEIRFMIESTYCEREDEPESWGQLFDENYAKVLTHRQIAMMNSNIWGLALKDEEGVQTRLNDMPKLPMVFCREIDEKHATFLDYTQIEIDADTFRLSTAQAIHKNVVKVPTYCFNEIEEYKPFSEYLRGAQTVARVLENGLVSVKGLKEDIHLYYTDELGLVIEKPTEREDS
jgi:CRISPR-associated endonuclease/helicase Cas3